MDTDLKSKQQNEWTVKFTLTQEQVKEIVMRKLERNLVHYKKSLEGKKVAR